MSPVHAPARSRWAELSHHCSSQSRAEAQNWDAALPAHLNRDLNGWWQGLADHPAPCVLLLSHTQSQEELRVLEKDEALCVCPGAAGPCCLQGWPHDPEPLAMCSPTQSPGGFSALYSTTGLELQETLEMCAFYKAGVGSQKPLLTLTESGL